MTPGMNDGGAVLPAQAAVPGPGAAGASAPPFALPGSYFAVALVFWSVGALGLVRVASDLASGLFPLPRVVAVTHLFTLGWITTSILGALCQLLPVVLREPLRSTRAAYLTLVLEATGLPLFVAGLVWGERELVLAGVGAFASGLLVFVGNLAATLARVRRRDTTWWALGGAALFLTVSIVLGGALAGNLEAGYLGGERFLALGVHVHVAIAGWALLVVVGVARHLLPMFLLSHGAGTRAGDAAAALIGGGALVLVLLHHAGDVLGRWIPAFLIGAGAAAFLVQAGLYFRHRRRPRLDAGMRLMALSLGFLALALGLAPLVVGRGFEAPRLATGYGATLVLGLGLLVAAHYYKILPFLVWYHRFGPLAGRRPLPRVGELYHSGAADVATVLLAAGAAGLVAGVLAGAPAWSRAAAGVHAVGAGIAVAQMIGILRRRPE